MRHLALASLFALLPLAVAYADALVIVEVRGPDGQPVDGKVTLAPRGEGTSYSCETTNGACRIEGVPGGRYTARLEPREGEAPPPSSVVVPPDGRVVLRVAAR
ncbi:MAG: hypothetical protein AAGH15_08125 [Myxococcota bacterium]